ncbi:hypothetical protein EIP91_002335 [Steccherinum ochraceum]|uniref:Uncharacterized protein n=1 Tax=Steccherinum ochraceum TaxID=92696 RepID=A0A4R0REB6_9APHY|nr:hypothetical protein EIP91_002335 [Steccherinum ochraceum]
MSQGKDAFKKGVSAFRTGKTNEALQYFTDAIKLGVVDVAAYDSRAAVLEKLGRHKEALNDSKKVIDIDPSRWQGYARSARLFATIGKLNAAQIMANTALQKIKPEDTQRRQDMELLLQRVQEQIFEREEAISRRTYHFGSLPVEMAQTIFELALDDRPSRVVHFAAVCRGWRTTLLQAPSFWTHLHLASKRPERKAKLWMVRNRGKLEGLHLLGKADSMMLCLRELKGASLAHLRALTVKHLSLGAVCSALPSLTPAIISQLHDVSLSNLITCSQKDCLWEPEDLQLRTMTVEGQHPIHWEHIREHCTHLRKVFYRGPFATESHTCRMLADLICANVHLESFELIMTTGHLWFTHGLSESKPPTVSNLTRLVLAGSLPIPMVLEQLVLPNLEYLRMEMNTAPTDFHSLMQASGKTLQELSLISCHIELQGLLSFLQDTPNLRVLDIQSSEGKAANDVAEALAASLDASPEVPVLCPALTHINFSHSPKLKMGPVVRTVKDRLRRSQVAEGEKPTAAAIQSLILDGCPDIDGSTLPWLRSVVPSVSCVYLTKNDAKRKR